MPAQMVQCIVCRKVVSKRSTLSLRELGGGDGRACRIHQLVQDLVESQNQRRQEEKVAQEVDRAMKIMTGAALVRNLHTFSSVPPDFIYARLRSRGYSSDIIEGIKAEVDRQGGPVMSEDDVGKAAAMAMMFKKKDLA